MLTLRPVAGSDAARIHEWASQSVACRYQPWGPNSAEQTQTFADAAAEAWTAPGLPRRVWVAVDPRDGVVGLGELKHVGRTCREIAYAVHVALWGRGVGTQIARLLIETAFAEPAVERVQATCDPRNGGSAAVLTKVGMTLEGTLRHTAMLRDGWRDSRMFSILAGEWKTPEPTPVGGRTRSN